MKAFLILMMFVSAAVGQTNEVISELRIGERVLKNAKFGKVGATEIYVYHDGGIAKVPLQDLPEPYKTQFPIDAGAVAKEKAESDQKKKKMAEQQAALVAAASWRGEAKRIFITEVKSPQLVAIIEGEGQKEILLNGVPATAKLFFDEEKRLKQQVAVAAERLREAKRNVDNMPSSVSGSAEYVAAWHNKMVLAKNYMNECSDSLREVGEKHETLMRSAKTRTRMMARQTGQRYGNFEVWEYSGPAIDRTASE